MSFEARQEFGSASDRERQLHRGRLAVRIDVGLIEVGMAVEEEEAMPAAPPERQQGAEKNRAVTAEHEGEIAVFQHRFDRIGEAGRPVGHGASVQRPGRGVARWVIRRHIDAAGAARTQLFGQALLEQPLRQHFHA